MKSVVIAALLLILIPLPAAALDTSEILGLVAMPLAVAAASEVTGVPAGELSNLIASLNRARMPATEVVQVIRYAPVALVADTDQASFVQFVDQEVDRGIAGSRLVTSIDQRLRTYDVDPQFVTLAEPATTYVVSDDYLVQSRPAGTNDLLALIALPLAIDAVADATGVSLNEITGLVAMLNGANVAPVQVIEVLRYAPVALVADETRPQFLQFVDGQVTAGVSGLRLVSAIEARLQTYDVSPRLALAPSSSVRVVDQDFFPPVVRTHVARHRGHPHGGPPGQLKKTVGVQTGAEIVHGSQPASRAIRQPKPAREGKQARREQPAPRRVVPPSSGARTGGPNVEPPGQRKKNPANVTKGGNPKAQAKGKGKGKGKD